MKTTYGLHFNPKQLSKDFCYHGSTYYIQSGILKPRQGKDLDKEPDNELFAIYASDRASISISMSILRLPGVRRSGLRSNSFPHGIVYEGKPDLNQKIYLYACSQKHFHGQEKNPRQRVCMKEIPIEQCYILDPNEYSSYFIYENKG